MERSSRVSRFVRLLQPELRRTFFCRPSSRTLRSCIFCELVPIDRKSKSHNTQHSQSGAHNFGRSNKIASLSSRNTRSHIHQHALYQGLFFSPSSWRFQAMQVNSSGGRTSWSHGIDGGSDRSHRCGRNDLWNIHAR